MRSFIIVATFLSMLLFSGCGSKEEKSPVKVEAKILVGNIMGMNARVPQVHIISVVDSITIKDVVANNGNCRMTAMHKQNYPKTIKYGEIAQAVYTNGCNLLKIEIITDKGNWTQEFEYIPEEYVQM